MGKQTHAQVLADCVKVEVEVEVAPRWWDSRGTSTHLGYPSSVTDIMHMYTSYHTPYFFFDRVPADGSVTGSSPS